MQGHDGRRGIHTQSSGPCLDLSQTLDCGGREGIPDGPGQHGTSTRPDQHSGLRVTGQLFVKRLLFRGPLEQS